MHQDVIPPPAVPVICRWVHPCRFPRWLLSASLAVLLAAEGHAQIRSDPLQVEDAVQMRNFAFRTPIHLSPDGDWVAYTVRDLHRSRDALEESTDAFTATGVWAEAAGTQVHITRTDTGETLELAESGANSWAPVWSPDGAYLAFYSDRAGEVNLWVWERADNRLRRVSAEVVRPAWTWETPRWTPDARAVVVKLLPEGTTLAEANTRARRRPSEPEPRSDEATVRVFGAESGPAAGEGPSEGGTNRGWYRWAYGGDLALVHVDSGAIRRLASGLLPRWWDVSADGEWLAFTHSVGWEKDTGPVAFALAVVPASGGEVREIARTLRQPWGSSVSWSPDGGRLAYINPGAGEDDGVFIADPRTGAVERVGDSRSGWAHPYRGPLWSSSGGALHLTSGDTLWEVDVEQGSARAVATVPDRAIASVLAPRGGPVWSPQGNSVVLRARDPQTGRQGFFRVDLGSGRVQALVEETGSYGSSFTTDVSADGSTVVLSFSDAQQAPDLWLMGAGLRRSRRLTRLNPQFDRYSLGVPRLIEWITADGNRLHGALLLPPDHQEGVRVPLIAEVYGGRMGSSQMAVFNPTRQLLATRGYAVLVPDAPVRVGTPLRDLAETVLPGIDRAVELGIADPERLGIMGNSYGGYGTLALLVQTDRFRAAAASASQGNLFGMHSQLDAGGGMSITNIVERGQGRMRGTPWELRDRYIENSPYFFLDRVETPLLLLHGADDRNTPAHLAEQAYVGLRRLGRTVVYARYEGEDHWWGTWRLANQIDYWRRIIGWFDEQL